MLRDAPLSRDEFDVMIEAMDDAVLRDALLSPDDDKVVDELSLLGLRL